MKDEERQSEREREREREAGAHRAQWITLRRWVPPWAVAALDCWLRILVACSDTRTQPPIFILPHSLSPSLSLSSRVRVNIRVGTHLRTRKVKCAPGEPPHTFVVPCSSLATLTLSTPTLLLALFLSQTESFGMPTVTRTLIQSLATTTTTTTTTTGTTTTTTTTNH